MMAELYNDLIVAESKAKIGHGSLQVFDSEVTLDNPLCGDRVTIQVTKNGDRIEQLAHKTRGCILTQASMSILSRHAQGLSKEEGIGMEEKIKKMWQGEVSDELWSELRMLEPVGKVHSRKECVLLPFYAIRKIFEQTAE